MGNDMSFADIKCQRRGQFTLAAPTSFHRHSLCKRLTHIQNCVKWRLPKIFGHAMSVCVEWDPRRVEITASKMDVAPWDKHWIKREFDG